MSHFEYAGSPFPIRADIEAAHREYWDALSRPGSWWRGPERVAIAEEVRRARACRLCAERKAALSPFATDGEHDAGADSGTELPPAAVEGRVMARPTESNSTSIFQPLPAISCPPII